MDHLRRGVIARDPFVREALQRARQPTIPRISL
jgi:hypothetical protein